MCYTANKEGQFYYAPHRSLWGVWRLGKKVNNVQSNDFVRDFATKEEAREFVYKENNWKL